MLMKEIDNSSVIDIMNRIPDQKRFNEYLLSAERALAWLYDGMQECMFDLEYVQELFRNFAAAYNLVQRLMFLIDCPSDVYNKTSLERVENLRRSKIRAVDTFDNWEQRALKEKYVRFIDDLPF